MSDSFFYSQVNENKKNRDFLKKIEEFSKEMLIQIYVLNKPLGENKYNYNYEDGLILLVPKYKMIFVNFNRGNEEFEDYVEDFIEDIGYISDKYGYKKILGRPRVWKKEFFEKKNYEDISNLEIDVFLKKNKLKTKESERNGEYLISLLTGSINDIERIGGGFPENLLDQIKRKIVLFDGDQTKFIYQEPFQKRITIQGLAGTGKTELLLHKLKDLYIRTKDIKIVFTCHNKILAQSLKIRIPEFFNFMKVEEQIKWEEKLWTMHGWGSKADKNSGVYSYICNYYNISFQGYSYGKTFEKICKDALEEINNLQNFVSCFDYILIDESQDFPESFFELCEKVTKTTVYIAGDIFQNVFDEEIISEVTPDFLLNKCYRTDSRTLMFAHGIGMGLFEKKLRWLKDEEWKACGYKINKKDNNYLLSREPLRRFEDLESEGRESIKLISSEGNKYVPKIIEIIENIVDENPTVEPDDIGIVFLENISENYLLANKLQVLIKQRFGWTVNIGYESKIKIKGTVFISNRNNVKGLEFPFAICVTRQTLTRNLKRRNSIYMMLTRSFLTTYFLVDIKNGELINKLEKGLKGINENNFLTVEEPPKEEIEQLRNAIITKQNTPKSQYDLVEAIMNENNVKKESREVLHKVVETLLDDELDKECIDAIIKANYDLILTKSV